MIKTKPYLSNFMEEMSRAYSELEDLLEENLCDPDAMSNEEASKMMTIARRYMNNYALVVREMKKKAYAEEDRYLGRRLLKCFKYSLSGYRLVEHAYKRNKANFLDEVFDLISRPTGLEANRLK